MIQVSDNEWLTAPEAARMLRVSVHTIHRYVRDGEISGIQLPGGQYRIRREEIERLLEPRAAS